MNKLHEKLVNLGVCEDSLEWINNNNIQTPDEARERCKRADWMLWMHVRMAGQPGWSTIHEVRTVVRWCASTVLHLWDAPDVVKRYLETGDESIRDDAARAAAYYAADAAAYAAYAAAYAAYAADAAAYAAAYAAYAAAYAAYAADAAAYADAYVDADAAHHKLMCDHIRKNLTIGELL